MCIIKKVFSYEETELPVIKYKDDIWFRGKTVVEILGYAIQRRAIREHVDAEDRVRLTELCGGANRSSSLRASGSRGSKTDPLTNNDLYYRVWIIQSNASFQTRICTCI